MTQPHPHGIVCRTFRPGDEEDFRRLNEDWICKFFDALEPHDREMLDDPHRHILAPGGQIFIAEADGAVVGTCALIPVAPGEFELAKMTVAEQARGSGTGRKLLRFAISVARQMGARRLSLESNTKAAAAVHLYEQAGFRHRPAQPSPYQRANVFMELLLDPPA